MRPILYAGVIFSLFIALGVLSGYIAHPFRAAHAEPVIDPEPVAEERVMPEVVFEDVSTITLPTGELRKFFDDGTSVFAATSMDGGETWGESELIVEGAIAPEVVMVDGGYVMHATVGEALVAYTSIDGLTFALSSE